MQKNNVKKIRESLLMGKSELARKAGISIGTLNRIENGNTCRVETQKKIIIALEKKLSEKYDIFPEH